MLKELVYVKIFIAVQPGTAMTAAGLIMADAKSISHPLDDFEGLIAAPLGAQKQRANSPARIFASEVNDVLYRVFLIQL